MSFMSGSYNPSDSFAPMANSFIQAIARSPIGTGLGMGRTGDDLNLAGLMGISDPGAAIALNQILQPLLMQVTGQKYTSAQYSGGTNMYTQMKVGNVLRDQGRASRIASSEDQQGIYNMMEGTSKLMGQRFGKNERKAARQFAQTMSEALPTLSQYAPDMVEGFFGERGSATIMSQNMFKGGRYAVDPVTGRRGYSAESAGEITKGVYNRLYGANADISEMSGITAGKAGAMFDEMQRRGLMPNSSSSRGKNLQGIAEQLGTTVADVSKLPDLDSKLREFDAAKISDRLKGMSKAVSAMQEVFGEMGEPNAPMTQLVGAIETLTQSSMQGMTPIQMEKMIRNTSNTAKVAGIEMPEMFRQMGITAGMADSAGVNRALVPGITNQAILENQASKNRFGGAKAFGMLSSDSLLNLQEQLGVQAARDDSTHDMASIIRAVEVYGHEPEKGSEFEAVYKALKDKSSGGEYEYNGEKKNVYTLTRQPGGVQGFLAKDGGVSASEINSLQYNREANSRIIAENELSTNVGRSNQNLRMVEDLARYSSTTISQIASDDVLMKDTQFGESTKGDSNALEISRVASEALVNVEPGEIGAEKAPGVVAAALTRHFKDKGVNIGEAEKKAIARMSAGIAEGSEKFATTRGMVGGTVTMQQLASKELFREAQATKAEVEVDTEFQQKFRSEGKQGLMSRVSDFVRNGSSKTEFNDFIATALNYQPTAPMAAKLKVEFDDLMKSKGAFEEVDEGKIRADYFQTKIANAKPEERQSIMDEMISSKFATEDSKEEEYKRFEEMGKLNKPEDNEMLAQSFKDRYGISMEEMKGKSGQQVRTIAKKYHSKRTEELAEKLHVSLKVAGVTFKGGARESELDKAMDEMNKADGTADGIDRYETFLNRYSTDSELYTKGGKEGEEIRQKSLESIGRLTKLADALGMSKDDLLEADQSSLSNLNINQLRDINDKEVGALNLMNSAPANYEAAQTQNKAALEKARTNLAQLEKEPTKNKGAIDVQKAEVKMREDLVSTKKDEVGAKLAASKKTQTSLNDPNVETDIRDGLAALKAANKQESDNKSAVEKFAKAIKLSKPELKDKEIKTKKDLLELIVPSEGQLKEVADLRAKLVDAKSPAERTKIENEIADKIKKSGAVAEKFNAVTDVEKVEAVLDKIKDLDKEERGFLYKNNSKFGKAYEAAETEFKDTEKKELERLDSKASKGTLSQKEEENRTELRAKKGKAEEIYRNAGGVEKDREEFARLKNKEKKNLSADDEKTLAVAEKQLGLSANQGRKLRPGELRDAKTIRDQRIATDPAFNAEVEKLIEGGNKAEVAKIKALKTLGEKDAKLVAAIGGAKGLKDISAAEQVSLARDMSELNVTLGKGKEGNTELSPTMIKALKDSANIQSTDHTKNNGSPDNIVQFFKNNLKTNIKADDIESIYRKDKDVFNKLAANINTGAAAASTMAAEAKGGPKSDKPDTPEQQMKALKTLLEKDTNTLTDSEKSLRAGLAEKKITKDIYKKNGSTEIDVDELKKIAEETIKKKKEDDVAASKKESSQVMGVDDKSINGIATAIAKAVKIEKITLDGTLTVAGLVAADGKIKTG